MAKYRHDPLIQDGVDTISWSKSLAPRAGLATLNSRGCGDMAQFDKRYAAQVGTRAETVEIDAGLRAYMLRVYNYMAIGVGLTGVVAYAMSVLAGSSLSALTPFGEALYLSPLRWVVMFAPLAFVMFLSFRVQRMSVATAQAAFWLFAAVMGASISWIFSTSCHQRN